MEVKKERRDEGKKRGRRMRSGESRGGKGQLSLWEDSLVCDQEGREATLVLSTFQDCGAGALPLLHQGG